MTDSTPSKSAIDRLGDRLRVLVTPDDLRMLNAYRLSFASAYEVVFQQIRITHGLEVSGRPAKSTTAIVDKLKRESIRLSQMQDVAGCRVVVADIAHQNDLSERLSALFSNVTIFDRRKETNHGYRAIHLVMQIENRHVEIQIRTELQQLWAELSEKFSDIFGIAVKYGGGAEDVQQLLKLLSASIKIIESVEPTATNSAILLLLKDFRTKIRASLVRLLDATKEVNDFPD
jgi:putative GTP pyrophosphokinase